MQPFKVAVKVTSVPEGIFVTVLAVLSTVPAVLVTVPLLVKEIVYVNKLAAQLVETMANVGFGLTVILNVLVVPKQPFSVGVTLIIPTC